MRSGLSSWYTGAHCPLKSTCAAAGMAQPSTSAAASLARRAGSRTPLRAIGFLLEVGAGNERAVQELRVADDGRHREPLVRVRLLVIVEVFGERDPVAIGNAVLAQISRPQVRGRHLERPSARADTRREDRQRGWGAGRHRRTLPVRHRVALPRGFFAGWRRAAEAKEARLCAGVALELQRRVILPRDMHAG